MPSPRGTPYFTAFHIGIWHHMPGDVDLGQVPGRVVHLQGFEDVGPAVVGEILARHLLDQVSEKAEGDVVVVPPIPGCPRLEVLLHVVEPSTGLQVPLDPVSQRDDRVPAEVHPAVPLTVPDGRAVREQTSERDRDVWMRGIPNRKGHVAADVVVQLEPALFPQLHEGCRGEGLRYGADVLNPVQAHGQLALEVGEPISVGPDHTVVLHEARGDAGNVVGVHPVPDERVDLRRRMGGVPRIRETGEAHTTSQPHGRRDEGSPVHLLWVHPLSVHL